MATDTKEKMTTIKALTLWQPWARLIWDGRKKIETRSWEILYRGPLAIHAGKKVDKEACRAFGYDPAIIPLGAVLCIVSVQGCVRFPHPYAPPDPYGDFSPGRYGFLLSMLEKLPMPIPAVGHQGLWDWPYQPSQLRPS
jgi:activating signal cointegrator 1